MQLMIFRQARAILLLLLIVVGVNNSAAQNHKNGEWISLFNGEDLNNWIVKFTGYKIGENYNNTFRVENGVLRASFEDWEEWNGQFGHIFYDRSFSNYIIRVEYRFVGEQVKNGPGWAFRNNGLMLHSQDPRAMTKDQEFPVSIETQLLGGDGANERSTLNVCTPGTHIVREGELITQHCINSDSNTYHGDQWVSVEITVRGNEIVQHKIDGDVVFEYTNPQFDERDADAQKLISAKNLENLMIEEGYIALQAESHPTEFRRIEVKILGK